jgi:hypothetical protein
MSPRYNGNRPGARAEDILGAGAGVWSRSRASRSRYRLWLKLKVPIKPGWSTPPGLTDLHLRTSCAASSGCNSIGNDVDQRILDILPPVAEGNFLPCR